MSNDLTNPDLADEPADKPLGKYGLMRMHYLEDHRYTEYVMLLIDDQLQRHLHEVDQEARSRVNLLMEQLKARNPPPPMRDQMAWVAHMNMLQAMAEEMVLPDTVYSNEAVYMG
jgi:hypothetical protein